MIESGDIRYFCSKCGVLIEELGEDSVIRCPSCNKLIRRGVCAIWDSRARFGRVQIVVRWSNARGTRTLLSYRAVSF